NWKMNTNCVDARALAARVASGVTRHPQVDVAICPPFPYLSVVRGAIEGSAVEMGAQNLSSEPSGAFTGEVSGAMLVDVGCRYCIVGHSERRHVMGGSASIVSRQIKG